MNNQLIISTVLLTPAIFILTYFGFHGEFKMLHNNREVSHHTFFDVFLCIFCGLVAGLIIGYVTKVMTSYAYRPVV